MINDVTIAIPLYKSERYLKKALTSALNQTYPYIDYLLVDDGSDDGAMELIKEFQQTHPRGKDIRVISHEENLGIGEARNRLIAEAKTKYIFFLDADDVITPNAISVLHEHAVRHQADVVYGSHRRLQKSPNGIQQVAEVQYPSKSFYNSDDFANFVYRKYDGIQATMWNILIDLEVFRKNQVKFLPIHYWEDFMFTMDLPLYVNRAVLLPDITYDYCLHADSLKNRRGGKIKKSDIIEIINALEHVKRQSFMMKAKTYFPKRMFKVMLTDFYVVCNILKNKRKITPVFTNEELHAALCYPLTFREVMRFRVWRVRNLLLYLSGVLPPSVSVLLIKIVAKYKGLI